MLNHLSCAVGPLHSQKIVNFGVGGGGGGLTPKAPPLDPPLIYTLEFILVSLIWYRSSKSTLCSTIGLPYLL